jgi:hypothetical protein
MSIATVLMKALGAPLAKFLLKKYLSDPAEAVGVSLVDLTQKRITDYADQRKAQRQFEDLGERIVARLVPLFEHETRNTDISVPAVAAELAETLGGRISAGFFLTGDLDPAQLTAALRAARPLNIGHFSAPEIALYDRALDESVRYVVQVASRLPKFEEAYASVSLQRLGRMSDELEEVLDTTRRIELTVTRLAARSTDADEYFARYEADYRQAVMRNLDYLELFGADISLESRRHALSVAYISLNLKKSAGTRDQAESLPVATVLDSLRPEEGRVLIRGEAGSGKSTLSRWTAIQAASFEFMAGALSLRDKKSWAWSLNIGRNPDSLSEPADVRRSRFMSAGAEKVTEITEWERQLLGSYWRLRIPFLVRLRDCKDGQLPRPDDFPSQIAKEIGNPPPDWVASILRQGKALILLDGIDEVPNVHREQLRWAIENIVATYPNNYFLASTRPTAVEEGWLTAAGFREATVDPMSEVDRTLFIQKWHDAVGRELSRLGRPDPILPQIASGLVEQLPEHPPVARLATNPLLCSMICALHRERSQKLPESQSELCEAICHMLLHRRERESGLSMDAFPEAYRALTYPEKRAIVQDIAHYMVRNGESTIDWERARQSVQDSLKQFPDRKGIDANELLKLLIERSGVLRETRPGEIDFIHNTLKEYLAAERFADGGDAGQLADKYADASWQPVILFSVATNRREFASAVVQRVLHPHFRKDHLNKEELRARRLFALRCRAAALHLFPELITELDSIEASLFPPRSMADADALASGGDAAVDYLASRKRWSAREAAACIRALRLIGTRKADRALRTYLNDSRSTVVSELVQALNPLEIALVRNMLQRGNGIPEAVRAQIADLNPISDLNIVSLDLRNTRVADLMPLSKMTQLRSLELGWTLVRDLIPLDQLTGLESLGLEGTQVSDLTPLAKRTGLKSLNISKTQVTDLVPLTGLRGLHTLNLGNSQASDLAPLAGLTSLQSLNVWNDDISDVAPLAGLTSLNKLTLWTNVDDLTPLAELNGLQLLDLLGTPVSNLAPLAGLTHLQFLDLRGTWVDDLKPLAGLTNLQMLDISQTLVSDLAPLAGLTNLQSLNIEGTAVSDLTPLTELKLNELTISEELDASTLKGNAGLKIHVIESVGH